MQQIIDAAPSKMFFIDFLTRDITLGDAVMDLVDNSVHSLVQGHQLDVMKRLLGQSRQQVTATIKIDFTKDRFRITDTCGGISIRDAAQAVFRFGAPEPIELRNGLGVYGIGMKRAFFKIGKFIRVQSATDTEHFTVEIPVEKWRQSPDWTLAFEPPGPRPGSLGRSPGTTIEITDLNDPIGEEFEQVAFEGELIPRLSTAYALFLEAGLRVWVNGKEIKPDRPQFAEDKTIRTARRLFQYEGVDILILAGLTPRSDPTPRGCYVFCNGRMVVRADKTEQTGWGRQEMPEFHPKYNHVCAFLYFRSSDLLKLPWTTTKEGVVRESSVYQKALAEMRVQIRPILSFCNKMYPVDLEPEGVPQRDVHQEAKTADLATVAQKSNTFFMVKTPRPAPRASVSIQYSRPLRDVNSIRERLGKPRMPARRIGEHTFDWFLTKECE